MRHLGGHKGIRRSGSHISLGFPGERSLHGLFHFEKSLESQDPLLGVLRRGGVRPLVLEEAGGDREHLLSEEPEETSPLHGTGGKDDRIPSEPFACDGEGFRIILGIIDDLPYQAHLLHHPHGFQLHPLSHFIIGYHSYLR